MVWFGPVPSKPKVPKEQATNYIRLINHNTLLFAGMRLIRFLHHLRLSSSSSTPSRMNTIGGDVRQGSGHCTLSRVEAYETVPFH